jgi:hypothetical protein
MTSRFSWGSESTKSRSKTSFTLALLVFTSGAFSTDLDLLDLVAGHLHDQVHVGGRVDAHLDVLLDHRAQLGRVGAHLEGPGIEDGEAEAALLVGCRSSFLPPIWVADEVVILMPFSGEPDWSSTHPTIDPESPFWAQAASGAIQRAIPRRPMRIYAP